MSGKNLVGGSAAYMPTTRTMILYGSIFGSLVVVAMIIAIVLPATLRPHDRNPPTAAPTTTVTFTAPTTAAPTGAPTPPPPLTIICPPATVVAIGQPLTVPPQALPDTNYTGCPPVQLSYVDAQYPGSQQLIINASATIVGVDSGNTLDTVVDASDIFVVTSFTNETSGGAVFSVYNLTDLTLLSGPTPMASLGPLVGPCAQAASSSGQVLYDHVAGQWLLLHVTAPPYNALCVYVSSVANPVNCSWRLYQFTTPFHPQQPKLALFGAMYAVTTVEQGVAVVYFIQRLPMLNFALNTQFFRAMVPFVGPGPAVVAPVDNEAGPQPLNATSLGGVLVMRPVDDELYAPLTANASVDFIEGKCAWALLGLCSSRTNVPRALHLKTWMQRTWRGRAAFVLLLLTPRTTVYQFTNINFVLGTYTTCNVTRIAVPDFNSTSGLVPQPAPGPGLPSLSESIMHRLVYRQVPANVGFTQSIVGSFATVSAGGIYSVYWFELRAPGNQATWVLYQTSIASGNTHAWTSALTMGAQGTIVLAYAQSSAAPSGSGPNAAAIWRVATRPLNTTQGPPVALGPAAVSGAYAPAWGAYHAMSAVPNDAANRFVCVGQFAPGAGAEVEARLSVLSIAPLHMVRTWTADDACMASQMCTQDFTSPAA